MSLGEQGDQSLLRPVLTLLPPKFSSTLGTSRAACGKHEVVITGLCLLAVDKTLSPEQLIFLYTKQKLLVSSLILGRNNNDVNLAED